MGAAITLTLLASMTCFCTNLAGGKLNCFNGCVRPAPVLLPVGVLRSFAGPLSLDFQLFKGVLTSRLMIIILISLMPLMIPVPIVFLKLFADNVRTLVFTALTTTCVNRSVRNRR